MPNKRKRLKTIINILFLMMIAFQLNSGIAVENIIGTWRGELPLDSGGKVTLQFLIKKDNDGAYSAVLSLPDEAGSGSIEASRLVFRSGKLTFDIPELNGSYDGMLTDGEIVGQWHQEGGSIPLPLSRFELRPLSDEEKEKLLGKWYGKDCPPGAIGNRGRYIFNFVMDEAKNFTGTIKVCFLNGKLDSPFEISELEKNEDDFIFKISEWSSEFRGRFVGKEIVGMMTTFGCSRSYTITKGEYSPDLNTTSDLPDRIVEFLSGKWNGKVAVKGNERVYHFRMLFEFKNTEAGVFKAHIIERDSFDEVVPITEATTSNEKLILKTEDYNIQFEMKLSGNTLTGEWIQCGVSYPITIVKEGS